MTVSERASSQNRRPCGYRTAPRLYTLPLALLNMEYGSVGQVNFGFLEAGAVIAMIRRGQGVGLCGMPACGATVSRRQGPGS